MDMSRYRDLFISESREHLQTLSDTILALEGGSGERSQLDTLFRAAHSLKGMAASMGYDRVAELSHAMEDLMSRVRTGSVPFAPDIADLLLAGHDLIGSFLDLLGAGEAAEPASAELQERLRSYQPSADAGATTAVPAAPPATVASAPAPTAPTAPPVTEGGTDHHHEPERTVRVKTSLLDRLINLTGELVTTRQRLIGIGRELASPPLDQAVQELAKLLRELQGEVQKVRLLPFSTITDRYQRAVRDLARKTGKDVLLVIDDGACELDRGILEELADPLLHILRNCVDHGIETPAERVAAGKPAHGTVRLTARREKDQVRIDVSDDGRGMATERLVAAAIQQGLLDTAQAANLSRSEALMLCCRPGLSTAREVTEVSGRGVGMDAVYAAVRQLGGALGIESTPGQGTTLSLHLPLTIAIMHVLLIGCGSATFAIPAARIQRMLDLTRPQVRERDGQKVFLLEEEEVPLLSLPRILGNASALGSGQNLPVVVTEVGGRRVGLAVDRFLGQQEVYMKPLGYPLNHLRGIAAGAILGSGEVIFLLDTSHLL